MPEEKVTVLYEPLCRREHNLDSLSRLNDNKPISVGIIEGYHDIILPFKDFN